MSGTAIVDPPIPPNAPLNFGDSIVLFDTVSGQFLGTPQPSVWSPTPPTCPPPCDCILSLTTDPTQALAFTVSDSTGAVYTPATNSNFVNYKSIISLVVGKYALCWDNENTNGQYMSMQAPTSFTTNNQFIFNPIYSNSGPIKATTLALFKNSATLCGGACNLGTLSSVLDNPGGAPKNPAAILGDSSNLCNNTPIWGKRILGGMGPTGKATTCQFQIFIVTPNTICGSNTNCPSGQVCFSGKCYPTTSLSNTLMNQVCNYDPKAPNNNLSSNACVAWCSSQPVTGQAGYRSACDTAMLGYCPIAFPDYKTTPPILPGPCTCTIAQLNNNAYPECFSSGCFTASPDNYYLGSQQQTLSDNGCTSACTVTFNCQKAGTCTVSNDNFCMQCGNQPGISDSCNGSSGGSTIPNFFTKIIDWVKANPLIPIGVAAGLFLLISIVFILIHNSKNKK